MDEVLNIKEKTPKQEQPEEIPKKRNPTEENNKSPKVSTVKTSPELWRKYKFIPGEKVIFYDDLKFEEVGEFPARWDLLKGGAEIAQLDNEKIICRMNLQSNLISM